MEDLINKTIENYKFVSVLGKGGMGVVYKAYDVRLDRFVAIKVLNSRILHKKNSVERFKREARHQAQLIHPQIVTVFGFLEVDGFLGIVMEYVEGESLEKLIHRLKKLHVNDAVYILRQLLMGVGYAHQKGFVHRDIKPSNVIINKDGAVKIMDFGISKSLFDQSVTKTGSKIGTVLYMSPEQIRGEDVDHLSDIYSLGCTFYEMISGEPPFYEENEYKVMDAHLKQNPKKLSSFISGVTSEVDKVVDLSLRKVAGERYQNCDLFLRDVIELENHLAKLQSEIFRHKHPNPKRKKVFSVLGFSILLLFVASIVYLAYIQTGNFLKSDSLYELKKYSIQNLFESDSRKLEYANFIVLNSGINRNVNAIKMVNDSYGLAVGDRGGLFKTVDNGNTFSKIDVNISANLQDVDVSKAGNSVTVGDSGIILFSYDQFNSYTEVNSGTKENLLQIKFINDKTAFAIGVNGTILRSHDSGFTWDILTHNNPETFFDIHFVNNDKGFIVGRNGTLLFTSDGGTTWITEESFTDKYLKSIDFFDAKNGAVVGGGGTVFITENGGSSWKERSLSGISGLQKVKYISEEFIIAVGSRGTLVISENGGDDWKQLQTNLYVLLTDITVTPLKKIIIAGHNGTLIKLK